MSSRARRILLASPLASLTAVAVAALCAPRAALSDPAPPPSCADAGTTFEQASTARTEYAFDTPGHVVEADGIAWFDIEEDVIELLGTEPGCWRGGLVDGPFGDDSVYECNNTHCPGGVCPDPCFAYHTAACMTPESAGGVVIEDFACANYGDGIQRKVESGDVVVRRVHLYDLKDDAIEDDYGLSNTRVFETLIDGVHIAFGDRQRSSQDNDATGTEWEVRDSLVRVRPNQNAYKQRPGHGGLWKADANPLHQHRYRVTDNVFVAQGQKRGGQLFPVVGYVDECAGNVLLWAGPIAGEGGWLEALAELEDRPDGLTDGERLTALNAEFPGCFVVVLKPETQPETAFLATPLAELNGSSWDELVAAWKGASPPPSTTTTTTTSTTSSTTSTGPTTTTSTPSTAPTTTTSSTTSAPTTTTSSTTTNAPTTTTSSTTSPPTTTTSSTTTSPPTTTTSSTTTSPPTTTTSSTTSPPTTTTSSTTTNPPTTTTSSTTTSSTTTTAPTTTTSSTTTNPPTTTSTTLPATPPSVAILSPASGSAFRVGDEVAFAGSANDPETGDVSASLVWSSQKDGPIGAGASFSVSDLTMGRHVITATATDPDGNAGSATISVRIRR